MNEYKFSPEHAFEVIRDDITDFVEAVGSKKIVIGVSGGKDSTVSVALACKIFGNDKVVGVSMPCNGQKDMSDVDLVFKTYGIKRVTIDIGDMVSGVLTKMHDNLLDISYDTQTNLPARIRMSTLYAVAQSIGGLVINTCNLSEDTVGYATLYGDSAGSYSMLQHLTVTEILALGDWLGVPAELCHKVPVDGLQPLTDEQKLGMTYADIDRAIREDVGSDEFKKNLRAKYYANKFKTNMIRIPGPKFTEYPNYIERNDLKAFSVKLRDSDAQVHEVGIISRNANTAMISAAKTLLEGKGIVAMPFDVIEVDGI